MILPMKPDFKGGYDLKRKNYLAFMLLFVSVLFFYGCAELGVSTPAKIISNPIGSSSVKIGMSKNQVESIYGMSNFKGMVYSDEWEAPREEWVYRAQINILPINAGYLSEDVYLYFDGNSLTKISDSPLGSSEEKTIK